MLLFFILLKHKNVNNTVNIQNVEHTTDMFETKKFVRRHSFHIFVFKNSAICCHRSSGEGPHTCTHTHMKSDPHHNSLQCSTKAPARCSSRQKNTIYLHDLEEPSLCRLSVDKSAHKYEANDPWVRPLNLTRWLNCVIIHQD